MVRGGLMHGKTSPVRHDGTGLFAGLPSPFTATRYHSLTIDPATLTDELIPNGHTETGIIMAARHHGAVQVKIDAVEPAGGGDALDDAADAGLAVAAEQFAQLGGQRRGCRHHRPAGAVKAA